MARHGSENKGKNWDTVNVEEPVRMKLIVIGDIHAVAKIDGDVYRLELIV